MSASRLRRGVVLLATSFFLGFSMAATAQLTTNAIFAGNNFGQTNQVWSYQHISDPGPGWEQVGFNDSGWQTGRALIAGEPNAWVVPFRGTIIGQPNNATNPPTGHARYFRTHFTWTGSAAGGTLLFNARCDDGAVIYVNGAEIYQLRPPTAPITHASVGSPLPCGGDADCGDDVFTAYAPSLVEGDNVLAVAVYQNATGSSDIVWGTGLAGIPGVAPTITDPNQPSNRVAIANHPTILTVSAQGSPPPTYQWFFEPEGGGGYNPLVDGPGLSGATSASLMISNMMMTDAGSYFCTANNPVGSATSRTNVVQFTADTNGPVVVKVSGSATFDRFFVEFDEALDSSTAVDTFNYVIPGLGVPPFNPLSATLGADGKTVTLLTSAQTPDTDYTIEISSIADLSQVNTMQPTQVVVHSWILTSCGGALFEAYNTGAGNAVADLTNHPDFPNRPSEVIRVAGFSSRLAYANDIHEGYGARMRALFIPPENGNWRLYLWADDGSQLWFNPNGPDAAGRQLLLNRTACCGSFASANSQTAAMPLLAGQGYYLEILYKEGTGGDYGQVAARLDGQPTPPTSEYIPGDQVGFGAVPPGIAGAINISQQPANATLDAPTRATFSVVASAAGAPFVCYQWQKAEAGTGVFSDLMGEIAPTYTTPTTSVAADNGDEYRVVVSAISGSLTSLVATLTVNPDVTRPTVSKVVSTSATGLSVVYSEMMEPNAATDTLNYALSGGASVLSAAADAGNASRINLTTTPMTLGTLYTLTMSGPSSNGTLEDTSGNDISPDPASATFRAQTFGGNVDTIRALPTAGRLPLGSLTQRGILVRLVHLSAAIANDNAITEQILAGVYPSAASPLPNIAPLPLHLETGMINYNKDGPTSMDGSLVPDAQFPGFGSVPLLVLDNLAMEAVCYVELQQGIYRTIVRSDDGFRLTTALKVEDPGNSFILGEFNGGRGTADSPTNDFCVTEAGLYPMRLIFEEGNGGAAVEWKIQDLETGAYYGVNGTTVAAGFPGGSPAAYLPPCADRTLNIQQSGANLIITWPLADGGNLFQLQQTPALANPPSATVWNNVGTVPQTAGTTKRVTLPKSGNGLFFRLFRPGPACTL